MAGHLQDLLKHTAPWDLQALGIALAVDETMVADALGLVDEASGGCEHWRPQEDWSPSKHAFVVLLGDPASGPTPHQAALTLALVWDLAQLVATVAQLSLLPALPTPLPWKICAASHGTDRADARVPVPVGGMEGLEAWATLEQWHHTGRPLSIQAELPQCWHWSVHCLQLQGEFHAFVASGLTRSLADARWNAESTTQYLVNAPARPGIRTRANW